MPNIPSLWRELAAIATHRRRPSATMAAGFPDGARYPVANGPVSGMLVPLVCVGLLADVPLSLVIVALLHPRNPLPIHLGIAALGLWSLGWAIAVRSVLRSLPHVVNDEALWLGGCIRLSGVIPKAAIERVMAIRVSRPEWMSEHGVGLDDVMLACGFDPPNLALEIRRTAFDTVRISNRQGRTPTRRWVLLYTDSPNALAEAACSSVTMCTDSSVIEPVLKPPAFESR